VKLALEIAAQVAAGLAAIHKQKLVHRDIKPSNIMVSLEEGGAVTAKIIDLGLAKPAPDAPAEAAISIPGAFAGTPAFASPERFAGIRVDIRSDLYSLGVVLWEMLTGHVVFRGSPAEVMYQHQHAPVPLDQRWVLLFAVLIVPQAGRALEWHATVGLNIRDHSSSCEWSDLYGNIPEDRKLQDGVSGP
jgi:serine/threonine protein kinase